MAAHEHRGVQTKVNLSVSTPRRDGAKDFLLEEVLPVRIHDALTTEVAEHTEQGLGLQEARRSGDLRERKLLLIF